jgi:serine/threonine protein kinase
MLGMGMSGAMLGRHALSAGTMLRQYRIESILGQGGFGITYLAFDTDLQRPVAIKECFPRDYVSREGTTVIPTSAGDKKDFDWALGKFVEEATTLAKFRHPGIVQVLQIIKDENNSAYMVLELIDGQPFDQWLKNAEVPVTEFRLKRIVMPMLDALEVVHANGIVHRDIAPDNIFIRKNGEAVLLDFGAARQTLTQRSRTMNLVVKDGYSAPEQYYTEGRQGQWTDVYAFGAVLYRAMTGKRPVDAMARLDAINNGEPDPIEPLSGVAAKGYSREFIKAVEAALAPQVKVRPQSLAAWRPMLLGNEAKAVRPLALGDLASADNLAATPAQKRAGSRRLLAVAAAAVVAIAGVGGVLAWQSAVGVQMEAEAWNATELSDTPEAYREFIARFGQSDLRRDAETALTRFSKPWATVSDSGNVERAMAVAARPGMIVAAGTTTAGGRSASHAIVKAYSEGGRERWKSQFGEGNNEKFNDIIMLDDGSVVAAGSVVGKNGAHERGLIVKFDAKGSVLWSREVASDRGGAIHALINDGAGGFVAAGFRAAGPGGGSDGWLAVLDGSGALLSERFFGDGNDDRFNAIHRKQDGALALVGESNERFWLVTLSASGTILLNRAFGGRRPDRLNAVTVVPTGEIVAVGDTESFGTNSVDAMILRVENDGKIPPKAVAEERDDLFKDVLVAADGGVLVIGRTSSRGKGQFDGWIRKYDSRLDRLLWERVIGTAGADTFEGGTLLEDGSIVLVGSTEQSKGGSSDFWIVRIGADGQYSSE